MSLNQEQNEAMLHDNGPMIVLAGPGTGKTSTLAARYERLSKKYKPQDVLAITFTKAAADELKHRLSQKSKIDPKSIQASTFHSLSMSLSRMYPSAFSFFSKRKLANDVRTAYLAQEAAGIAKFKEDEPLEKILAIKDSMTDLKDVEDESLVKLIKVYNERLKTAQEYDFSDLIIETLKVLQDNDQLIKSIRAKWPYIMVDEYQDVNKSQAMMTDQLAGINGNLWVVGDDDQALYSWRGGDVQLMLNFPKRHDKTKMVNLVTNYRCPPSVLRAAGSLIARNRLRFSKTLKANSTGIERPIIQGFANSFQESNKILMQIEEFLKTYKPTEIAVLARSSSALGPIERILSKANINHSLKGAPPFWERSSPQTALALIQVLMEEKWDIPTKNVPEWMKKAVLDKRRTKAFIPNAMLVCNFLKDTPPKNASQETKRAWIHLAQEALDEIKDCETTKELLSRIKNSKPIDDGIVLSTIHSSKGLEWPVVIVTGLEEGILPHLESTNLEEERRLAYVAITRTKKHLILSKSSNRNGKDLVESRFLKESGLR